MRTTRLIVLCIPYLFFHRKRVLSPISRGASAFLYFSQSLNFFQNTGASLILCMSMSLNSSFWFSNSKHLPHRMQRVFHAILTGRILLHLRMAVIQDQHINTNRNVRDSATPPSTPFWNRLHREQISSFVIGADTWFVGPNSAETAGSYVLE